MSARIAALLGALATLLAPVAALACPACAAGRSTTGSTLSYVALGCLIALPFAVSGVIIGLCRSDLFASAHDSAQGGAGELGGGASNPDNRARSRRAE
ncbi:MAG: hypothetical protein U0359_03225 [Byssovorax sp.]